MSLTIQATFFGILIKLIFQPSSLCSFTFQIFHLDE